MKRLGWAAIGLTSGLGGKTVTRLLSYFGTLEAALEADPAELSTVPGLTPSIIEALTRIDLSAIKQDYVQITTAGIAMLTWEDAAYPPLLLQTPNSPPVLWVRGVMPPTHTRLVAVVGTRSPSTDNLALAEWLGRELGAMGWGVVSGLALGIDGAVHRGVLAAGGVTTGVLGSGVLSLYPRRHLALADQVAESGGLLCEVHPRAEVSAPGLRARNRITSGLCRAVIVVQSQQDSGSAATARHALKQGRAVYVVDQPDAPLHIPGAHLLPFDAIDAAALSAEIDAFTPAPPESDQPRLF